MQPETIERVSQIVRDLTPQLDEAGFHVSNIQTSRDTGRLRIGYDESVDVPRTLVDAIAGVTSVGVDFVQEPAVALANFVPDDPTEPRRSPVSIEELIAKRNR